MLEFGLGLGAMVWDVPPLRLTVPNRDKTGGGGGRGVL